MFETLSKGFRAARQRLAGVAELTEETIDKALRDVRLSLLEADVELGVVKRFLAKVKEEALGQVVKTRAKAGSKRVTLGPAEQFIGICQKELTAMMAVEGDPIAFARRPQPTGIMMVGLQGSGKTTSAGKLARYLQKEGHKPLLVAADVQRPGAIEQLQTLGEQIDVPVFAIPGGRPVDICTKAIPEARKRKRDTIIYDTAGRLAVDEPLMEELGEIRAQTKAQNIFLVVDAMIGQDAVKTAKAFHDRLGLSGVVLTKLDGDARGGAALSVKEVTGAGVRFVGTGETLDRLEPFRAEGMASRILGMGDIEGLVRDFEDVVDQEKAEKDAQRMLKGQFSLHDFLEQIRMLQQMGPLQDMLEKLPFFQDSVPEGFQVDGTELKRVEAIVSSMTKEERLKPDLFQEARGRITRVAKGAGRSEKDVVDLLNRFQFMRQMMGNIGQQAGMLAKVPGMKQLAMANRLRDAVKGGGALEGNPMMESLAGQLLESAVADQGGRGAANVRRKTVSRSKKKQKRRRQKQARRKSRGS